MNKLAFFLLLLVAIACNRKPFVSHKVEFNKVADNCSDQQSSFQMNSNFGGERFEFEKCLPANLQKEQVTSTRQGDTVLVHFPQPAASGNVVYHITIDIDSYPEYHFITIGEDTYMIGKSSD